MNNLPPHSRTHRHTNARTRAHGHCVANKQGNSLRIHVYRSTCARTHTHSAGHRAGLHWRVFHYKDVESCLETHSLFRRAASADTTRSHQHDHARMSASPPGHESRPAGPLTHTHTQARHRRQEVGGAPARSDCRCLARLPRFEALLRHVLGSVGGCTSLSVFSSPLLRLSPSPGSRDSASESRTESRGHRGHCGSPVSLQWRHEAFIKN